MELVPHAVEAESLNQLTTREVPQICEFFLKSIPFLGYITAMCQEIIVVTIQNYDDCKQNDFLRIGHFCS